MLMIDVSHVLYENEASEMGSINFDATGNSGPVTSKNFTV